MHEEAEIKISYLLKNETVWKEITVLPDDYFWKDPDCDELNELPAWEDVSIHDDPVEYPEEDPANVVKTLLLVHDKKNAIRNIVKTCYWNDGKNKLMETSTVGDTPTARELITARRSGSGEIIISTAKSRPPQEVFGIFRFHREDEILTPSYHGIIIENEDGLESTESIYPKIPEGKKA